MIEGRVLTLRHLDGDAQQRPVTAWLLELDRTQRLVLLKILAGELRLGVSQTLVVRALAQTAALPAPTIAARLMGEWPTTADWFAGLISHETSDTDLSRPYPFYLAAPLDAHPSTLGDPGAWFVEWKWMASAPNWCGAPVQMYLWSRGEVDHAPFSGIVAAASRLPGGTVLDGESRLSGDRPPLLRSSNASDARTGPSDGAPGPGRS